MPDVQYYYPNYIQTYLEREVGQILNMMDLGNFQESLKLPVGKVGQVFNQSNFSDEPGINQKTVNAWLSVLETSLMAFRLPSYYHNFNKRILKTPKVYYYGTSVRCSLMGIKRAEDLNVHFARGPLFENPVILEPMKKELNAGKTPAMYYWRDNPQNEVDRSSARNGRAIARYRNQIFANLSF